MSSLKSPTTRARSQFDFTSAVPPTPAEAAACSARWERRGLLGRLVRAN